MQKKLRPKLISLAIKITLLLICLNINLLSPSPANASQPEEQPGVAMGTFTLGTYKGSGTLSFINIGGVATLVTECDMSTVKTTEGERCEGLNLVGTFSGGPNGIATFIAANGTELKFPLTNGQKFTFSTTGITMTYNVTDPSIFDDWQEETAKDSGARVRDLSGQVEIACPPDLEAWDVMKMGRVIYVDCHLKTGEDSSAEISFSDMTTFKMRPETEIVIDTPPEKESKISLIMGNVWVNVKQMIKDGTMEVHGSQAVAGIKGTTFVMEEDGTNSKLKVIEGVVAYTANANGESRDITTGQEVTATNAGLSEITTFDIETENNLWENTSPDSQVQADKTATQPVGTTDTKFIIGGAVVTFIIIVGLILMLKKKT